MIEWEIGDRVVIGERMPNNMAQRAGKHGVVVGFFDKRVSVRLDGIDTPGGQTGWYCTREHLLYEINNNRMAVRFLKKD
jgi:hypothetical protein